MSLSGAVADLEARVHELEAELAVARAQIKGQSPPLDSVIMSKLGVPRQQAHLLRLLMAARPATMDRYELHDAIRGSDLGGGQNAMLIDVLIGLLRKRIGRDRIVTVHGLGWVLDKSFTV
jgi:DNA-binding response OmpR family regulator